MSARALIGIVILIVLAGGVYLLTREKDLAYEAASLSNNSASREVRVQATTTESVIGPQGLMIKIESAPKAHPAWEGQADTQLSVVRDGVEMAVILPKSWSVVATSSFSFSPKGKYLLFDAYGYESRQAYIVDTTTGKLVLEKYYPDTLNLLKAQWFSADQGFILESNLNTFGGEGSYGIYRFDASKPEVLTTLYKPAKDIVELGYSLGNTRLSGNEKILTFEENLDKDGTDFESKRVYDLVDNRLTQ